jgi:hypothetical protein
MSSTDDSGDGGPEVEELRAELEETKRELRMLQDTLGESGGDLSEEVRQAIRGDEELQEEIQRAAGPSSDRRSVLKAAGAGLLGGAVTGAGTAGASTGSTAGSLDVGSVTPNTYRVSGNWYGGPASARTELNSELGSGDAGAKYEAEDTGAWYHWDGSSWTLLPGDFSKVTTEDTATDTATVSEGLSYDLSENNPHSPIGPELSAPPAFKPLPGHETSIATASDFQSATGDTTNFVADPFVRWDPHNQRFVVPCEVSTTSALKVGYLEGQTLTDLSPSATYTQTSGGSNIEGAFPFFATFLGDWYLAPANGNIYRQTPPLDMQDWSQVGKSGDGFVGSQQDVVFWRQNGRYWKAAASDRDGSGGASEIQFRYTDPTTGTLDSQSWNTPSWSPLSGGDGTAKQAPAGRPWVLRDGHLIMHYQDERDTPVRVSQFSYQLDTNSVTETETGGSPVVDGWMFNDAQSSTTHALDPIFSDGFAAPVAVVDYKESTDGDWGLGLVTTTATKPAHSVMAYANDQTIDGEPSIVSFTGKGRNMWSAADTANDQFVIPDDGLYRVSATVTMADHDPDSQLIAYWQENGSGEMNLSKEKISPGAGYEVTVNPSVTTAFSEGDTLQLAAEINGSATETLSGDGPDARQATLTRIS